MLFQLLSSAYKIGTSKVGLAVIVESLDCQKVGQEGGVDSIGSGEPQRVLEHESGAEIIWSIRLERYGAPDPKFYSAAGTVPALCPGLPIL